MNMFSRNVLNFNHSKHDELLDSSIFNNTSDHDKPSTSSPNKKYNEENDLRLNHPNHSCQSLFQKKSVKRKFPGPAGILPDDKTTATHSVLSQTSTPAFHDLCWSEMSKDYQISNKSLHNDFNIAWIKKEASSDRLVNQKSPFLAAVLHSLEISDSRPKKVVNVTLKDMTGEIQGTILYSLYEEHTANFTLGSVLVLKDIGILFCKCENCDNFYLTITPNNLASIYTLKYDSATPKVEKLVIANISPEDIIINYTRERRKLDELVTLFKEKELKISSNRFTNANNISHSKKYNNLSYCSNNNTVIRRPSNQLSNNINSSFKSPCRELFNKKLPSTVTSNVQSNVLNTVNDSKCSINTTNNVCSEISTNNCFRFKKSKINTDSFSTNYKTSSENSNIRSQKENINESISETIKMGSSQVSVTVSSKEHAEIWKELLEDVDIDSLLGEF